MIGFIYVLYDGEGPDNYIGSTHKTLTDRLSSHRCAAGTDTASSTYTNVYNHFRSVGVDRMEIELLEEYLYDTREELLTRERFWQDLIEPTLNMNRAWVSRREMQDQRNECTRKWRSDHPERYRELSCKYRAAKDPVAVKAAWAAYYLEHRERLNAKNKKRYDERKADPVLHAEDVAKAKSYVEANRDAINARARTKTTCPQCGLEMTKKSLAKHRARKH